MIHYLRTHSKVLLAITGVILMLTWLVFPAVSSLFEARGPAQGDYVKVSWRGGRLTAQELAQLKFVHAATVRFIANVIQETEQRQGTPRAPGYSFISLNPQNPQIGINMRDDDGSLLQTELLAQRAGEMGVKINDETVKNYLKKFSDYTITSERDLGDLLEKSIHEGTTVTQGMVFEYLKKELLAQQVRLMLQAGVESFMPGSLSPPNQLEGMATPGEMWSAYEKLNRRVTIEAFPLHVQDYVGKVTTEPKTADLQKLFEEGRTRLAHPAFDDPGFMQPHQVAFGYVKAELQPFLDVAKKEITDEEVAKAYEEGKAKGEYKVVEPPPMKTEDKPAEVPGDKPAEKPADKPEEKPADPNAPKEPTETPKPTTDKPATDKPATEEPKAEKPADKKDAEKKDAEKKDAEPKKNEGSALSRDIQLVNFQDEEKKKTEQPAETKPAAKPDETKTDDKPADTKPAETKPVDPAAKPADTKPADPAAKPEEEKPAEKEVKFKPLDEVQDEIRTTLARPIATERRQELLSKIITAVNSYGREYNKWKSQSARDPAAKSSKDEVKPPEKPAPLDLAKLLAGSPLKVAETPLVDQHELQAEVEQTDKDGVTKKVPKYEIARSSFLDFSSGRFQNLSFAEVAFQDKENFYSPETLPFPWENLKVFGGGGSEVWVYWRTDEVPAKERDFAAAQKDVLKFWKEKEALKLAEAAAAELAEKASKGQDLKSLASKPEEVITPPAFTWFTTGAVPGQFSQPTFSEIVGVKYPGQEFRQSVFDLQVGQAGIALEQSHRTVWVVKVLSEDGITEADRGRFMEKALENDLVLVAWQSQMPLQNDLYADLIKEYNVTWTPAKEGEGMVE